MLAKDKNKKRWKYIYESRLNNSFIKDDINNDILLLNWFGFSLKEKQIFDTKYKYLEFHKKTQISYIFNILIQEGKSLNLTLRDKVRILKKIKSYYNGSYIILKFIEKRFSNSHIIDFGAGCGIINYVYKKNNFKIKTVFSCDIIEFCKLSFKKLNKDYDKYLFDDEIYDSSNYHKDSVFLFRWSYDEMVDTDKLKVLNLLRNNRPKGIIISGEKHSDKNHDIDLFCLMNNYEIIQFNSTYPLNHGPTRVYRLSVNKLSFKRKCFFYFVKFMGKFSTNLKKNLLYIYFSLSDKI